ncbi:MAG: leucine-rich repeat protein [Clostridia bacterium]|nr:leucine-rich repeat protein [Clostridia bacterium]
MKRAVKITALILAFILPFATFFVMDAMGNEVYDQTYYVALQKQYDRLRAVNEEKVVLVGCSNVAFGIDSQLFEQHFGKPLVNVGLYGAFGSKAMLDLSKANLNRGDTVVIALEYEPMAYSLSYGAESMWKAVDGRWNMFFDLGFDNAESLAGTYFDYVATKFQYAKDDFVFEAEGVYSNDAVNEYGEIYNDRNLRPYNVMALGYQAQDLIYQYDRIGQNFIDYINDYVSYCAMRGVTVYFSFSPFNQMAMEKGGIEREDLLQFASDLVQNLDCQVISNPLDYVYDYLYFYDTNFHLNDVGVQLRTIQLVRDLQLAQGQLPSAFVPDVQAPERQQLSLDDLIARHEMDVNLETTPLDMFVLEQDELTGFYSIVGVTDQAKQLQEIVVPVIDLEQGIYITKIAENAFWGCNNLQVLTIPAGITEIQRGAFNGCSNLIAIRMLEKTGRYNIPQERGIGSTRNDEGMLLGSHVDCKIYLVNATWADYVLDSMYGWPSYGDDVVEGDYQR